MRDIEIQVLREVFYAIDAVLAQFEASGSTVVATRPQAYAVVIQAVIASAHATGNYGFGSLACAPLVSEILPSPGQTPWDAAVLTALMESVVPDL